MERFLDFVDVLGVVACPWFDIAIGCCVWDLWSLVLFFFATWIGGFSMITTTSSLGISWFVVVMFVSATVWVVVCDCFFDGAVIDGVLVCETVEDFLWVVLFVLCDFSASACNDFS